MLKDPKKEFYKRNMHFQLLDSHNGGFIYSVTDGGKVHYEVFKRIPNPRFGTYSYPGDESFGKIAWCINDKDRAMKKFEELRKSVYIASLDEWHIPLFEEDGVTYFEGFSVKTDQL